MRQNQTHALKVLCSYIWWQAETLSIRQGEQLVVIQNRVEIFNPLRVNITIEDDPLTLLQFTSNIVNDSEIERKKMSCHSYLKKVLVGKIKMT